VLNKHTATPSLFPVNWPYLLRQCSDLKNKMAGGIGLVRPTTPNPQIPPPPPPGPSCFPCYCRISVTDLNFSKKKVASATWGASPPDPPPTPNKPPETPPPPPSNSSIKQWGTSLFSCPIAYLGSVIGHARVRGHFLKVWSVFLFPTLVHTHARPGSTARGRESVARPFGSAWRFSDPDSERVGIGHCMIA
jgi:hypothetical protein